MVFIVYGLSFIMYCFLGFCYKKMVARVADRFVFVESSFCFWRSFQANEQLEQLIDQVANTVDSGEPIGLFDDETHDFHDDWCDESDREDSQTFEPTKRRRILVSGGKSGRDVEWAPSYGCHSQISIQRDPWDIQVGVRGCVQGVDTWKAEHVDRTTTIETGACHVAPESIWDVIQSCYWYWRYRLASLPPQCSCLYQIQVPFLVI